MFSDRTLIYRRNLKGNVSAAANACRRFFQLEIEARVVAAAMDIIGVKSINETQTENEVSEKSKSEKKNWLNNIATQVVDKFVDDQKRNKTIEQSMLTVEKELKVDPNKRYPCRFPGCPKSFAYNGKTRRNHEAKHTPPPCHSGSKRRIK